VEQLRNKDKIDLDILDTRLAELGSITQVDIYGGEPGILPADYANKLIDVVKQHTDKINIISNFSVIPDWYYREDITSVGVSFDWDQREQHDKVLNNIIMFKRPVSMLMLATEELIKVDPQLIASTLNTISNVASLEIKPYSTNQYNSFGMNFKLFEEWIKKWLLLNNLNFQLINRDLLNKCISKEYVAYSENHLYIDPKGNYSVLDFDLNDNEYFRPMRDLDEYNCWVIKERVMVENNKFCSQCKWQGHCATEHYRDVKSIENSCNGFKLLLDWYERVES
jgi:hypothetical protein